MTDAKSNRPEIFGTLLASKPRRSVGGTARSAAGALVLHAVLVAALVWATLAVGTSIAAEEEITFIELPPETPALPEPPPPPPPPEMDMPVPEAPEPVALGFQTISVPDIVPTDIPPPMAGVRIREEDFSGRGVEGGRADGTEGARPKADLSAAPQYTPYTLPPRLLNQQEVAEALQREYPPLLRDSGIGGTTVMWFFIDETGKVLNTKLFTTSGYDAFDEAAAKIAPIMKFSPAINMDEKVKVWVQVPIEFRTR